MGVFGRDPRREEDEVAVSGARGLLIDLELRACPVCRRELHPWQLTCPDDGAQAVAQAGIAAHDLAQPPAHLLEDEPEQADDD